MTKLIIRIKFHSMLSNLTDQLYMLHEYTLKSIITQSLHDYICFIEYSEKISKEILAWKDQYYSGETNFIFTTNMANATQVYIKTLDINQYQDIRFIHLNQNEIYPKNLLTQIMNHQNTQPVLLIFQKYLYNIGNKGLFYAKSPSAHSFVYVCPVLEYQRYFFFYDYCCSNYLYHNFYKMPNETLDTDVITVHKSISNALVTSRLTSTEKTSLMESFTLQLL